MKLSHLTQTIAKRFNLTFIEPRSETTDQRRQERILNILLTTLAIVALVALLVSSYNFLFGAGSHSQNSLLYTTLFCVLIIGMIALSRYGYFRAAAIGFLGLLCIAALQLSLQWSFELQQALLMYVLIIVIAGVISNARYGLFLAITVSVLFLCMSYLQTNGQLTPDTSWKLSGSSFSDAIGYAVTFIIISIVSWLSNRENDRSLRRARRSERALAAERDSLELKVRDRTQEIENQQLIRLMELRRFAEFGRLSANLLHEVANPLTAASINLELIKSDKYSNQVFQARKNLQHLERYVEAARKQLKGEGEITRFVIRKEVRQVLRIIAPSAARNQVKIITTIQGQSHMYGDSVKFSQIIANLLLNAVEACATNDGSADAKSISMDIESKAGSLRCRVQDHGIGIPPQDLKRVFEPFYTTKSDSARSMGIGLSMVKQFAEEDFNGSITVTSSTGGTTFDLSLNSAK